MQKFQAQLDERVLLPKRSRLKIFVFLPIIAAIFLTCFCLTFLQNNYNIIRVQQHQHYRSITNWLIIQSSTSPSSFSRKLMTKHTPLDHHIGTEQADLALKPIKRRVAPHQDTLEDSRVRLANIIEQKLFPNHLPANTTRVCEQRWKQQQGLKSYPPIVNFVRLLPDANKKTANFYFDFLHYIAILSVERFLQPAEINIFTNVDEKHVLFAGDNFWWRAARRIAPCVRVRLTPLQHKLGRAQLVRYVQHEADFVKVKAVAERGGLSLDLDVFVLNGTRLREAQSQAGECVLSSVRHEQTEGLNAGFINCANDSKFAAAWLRSYATHFKPELWGYNQGVYPYDLFRKHFNNSHKIILRGDISDLGF